MASHPLRDEGAKAWQHLVETRVRGDALQSLLWEGGEQVKRGDPRAEEEGRQDAQRGLTALLASQEPTQASVISL